MKQINIPFIANLLIVSDPDDIVKLNANISVSRKLNKNGSLLNKLLYRRINKLFHINNTLLPIFLARDNKQRQHDQMTLRTELDQMVEHYLDIHKEPIAQLAKYVLGLSDIEPGIIVQELIGRMFDGEYVAGEQSYAAALKVDSWPRLPPFVAIYKYYFGGIKEAMSLLQAKANNNPACIHGTAIAMHNIVTSLERMRKMILEQPGLDKAQIISHSMVAPRVSLRVVTQEFTFKDSKKSIQPGTIVIFKLRDTGDTHHDVKFMFMQDQWSYCPAYAIIMAIIESIVDQASCYHSAE